ncbi:MAG: response regulator [Candidatus Geothermincolales bacterium]
MKRIAYIEDDPDMIDLVSLILEKHGYDVLGFTESRDVVPRLLEAKPDLILLDLMMPHVDGLEVYRRIKENEELKYVPLIVISAMKRAVEEMEGDKSYQVESYLVKPFTIGELLDSIKRAVG